MFFWYFTIFATLYNLLSIFNYLCKFIPG